MIVTKVSMLSGKTSSMELNVTNDQLDRWKGGELIQNVFPHLTPDEREFLMTGSTAEEFDSLFGNEEEE